MRIIFVVFLLLSFVKAEDFITKMEYAKMLYSNPRGIGCNKCHGEQGNGEIIAKYKNKGKKIVLKAPSINSISFSVFDQALKKTHKVMPTYFLTENEIEILYFYVTSEANK
ncbi:MAG: cytochrome c [Epsilonproteobacteria bacterium]|nr:cytochrome c [Campylobacterota bacterium]